MDNLYTYLYTVAVIDNKQNASAENLVLPNSSWIWRTRFE